MSSCRGVVMDPVRRAVEDFSKLQNLIAQGIESGILDEDMGQSFRARARSVLSMIEDVGLVPALSFCYARATKSTYNRVVSAWQKGWGAEAQRERGKKVIGKEEGGYAFYLFLVLSYLRELGVLKKDPAQPVEALGELVDVQVLAAKLLTPYCIQLKKLAEAVYTREKPGGE
ncbi:MAG: type III-B CRISPR module-associated protein Cmr5 [Thermofilum sp.]